MKVRELIEILEEVEPDANVLIMSQENWPFENDVYGVTVREELSGEDADEDGEDGEDDESSGAPSDVFIVQGSRSGTAASRPGASRIAGNRGREAFDGWRGFDDHGRGCGVRA